MIPVVWAGALVPVFSAILSTNALIFELPSHAKRSPHHRLAQKSKRAVPILPSGWTYQNCYTDGAARSLTGPTINSDTMTNDKCVSYCATNGYIYAATEYSRECYCGNSLENGATVATSGCNMMCNGDTTQVCGGGFRISVYKSSATPPPAPSTLATYNNWGYQGCLVDAAAARSLGVGMGYTGALTPQKCLDACHGQGYLYAGMEYSVECYCANALVGGGVLGDASTCNMPCAGNAGNDQYLCGGPNRVSYYQYGAAAVGLPSASSTTVVSTTTQASSTTVQTTTSAVVSTTSAAAAPPTNGWTSMGCYTDNVALRTLAFAQPASDAMTIEKCQATCLAGGFKYSGVEWSIECYCANAITQGAGPANDGRCSMPCSGNAAQTCGGGNGLNMFIYGTVSGSSTSAPASSNSVATSASSVASSSSSAVQPATPTQGVVPTYNGWTYMNCYADAVAARTIPVAMAVTGGPGAMTVQLCLDACKANNYPVAGLEYSGECYCGNALPPQVVTDGRCNMYCNGAGTQICGGPNGLTVYQYGIAAPSSSSSVPVTSSTSTPASSSTSAPASSVSSVSSSSSISSSSSVSSVSSASSTSIISSTTISSSSSSASATQTGPAVVQTYGNWESQGCWSDDPAARSLTFVGNTGGANTPQKCMDFCYSAGYNYAGVEYAAECYCGTAISNGGVPKDDGCTMLCQANALAYCGGPFRLNVYKYNGVVPPPTVPVGGGGGVVPENGVTPLTTGLPAGWAYKGCWIDGAGGRILPVAGNPVGLTTPATCIASCAGLGYAIAGVEFGAECFCSNTLNNAAAQGTEASCNMGCAGDMVHACGGPNRMTVYSTLATMPVFQKPQPRTADLPGQYKYQGCYLQPPGGKIMFKYEIKDLVAMSVTTCLAKCAEYGYTAAALELGSECSCGDPSEVAEKSPGLTGPEECNAPCRGAPYDICGGVSRVSLYFWDQTVAPLYVWHTPANTGHYELLIGGIVIPLIATLGLNNKVTFMEKGGTGAANSTGAYELDYTLASDYTKAWRPMHVASDVFCAANLVLPDRKGRVLSIGGWSGESTEGIRLYTPSGSPGVNGTTDWEEHYDEIHLQKGRWYPGAMQMANGSIMVIGGEDGSNGRPVPSLEVLPKPAGGPTFLTMDWLLRTDPNNLYPFSFVLPGGGIFIIYFNEARILNEVTFETTKTFPLIPGSVDAAGGRTYPMEGTSMILPQVYPYTDPVEILTCGGSAFGIAFDNCVSIQPEVENPTWVIERMPSKRVMTIMTALPDGTYIIMGGAKEGVAGFGLARDPNLQAILYDPNQPRNQRFSILGETSVARLYHSEAILLHDGRVLVTGSDPEDDGQNPQEYRMEVYVPPYLTSGLQQPTFTITQHDWTYNGVYTIQVQLFQGSTANLKVSLLGAVSTTHGNSFGQRTIFPKVACTGNACQITAPPDAHTCPPGWFQLFVLDGPTPSYSQWVRIGGDPGSIGNWPNYTGFTLPGLGAPDF